VATHRSHHPRRASSVHRDARGAAGCPEGAALSLPRLCCECLLSEAVLHCLQIYTAMVSTATPSMLPCAHSRGGVQSLGQYSPDATVLSQSCQAWLLIEGGKPEAALFACPAAVQPSTLPASTKFTVAHVRAVALARFSMLQKYVGDAAPALHQALDRLNRAINEASGDLPQIVRNAEEHAGPLQASAIRACASASPFVQPPITALVRTLVLKELATVHKHIGHNHACAHLRAVMFALCNAGCDSAERFLGGYDCEPVTPSCAPAAAAPPFAEAELTSVLAHHMPRALLHILSLDVCDGLPRTFCSTTRSDPPQVMLTPRQPPRPLMQSLTVCLCEEEAEGMEECGMQTAWLLRGLAALTPQLHAPPLESAVAPAGNIATWCSNHAVRQALHDALRSALLTGGGGDSGVVRMLLCLARAVRLEWPNSGLDRDSALCAAMLMSDGHLRLLPGAHMAWGIIEDACAGDVDADAATVLQVCAFFCACQIIKR
jgi:hypothetical protein